MLCHDISMHDSDIVAEPLKFAGRVKCLLKVEKGT